MIPNECETVVYASGRSGQDRRIHAPLGEDEKPWCVLKGNKSPNNGWREVPSENFPDGYIPDCPTCLKLIEDRR